MLTNAVLEVIARDLAREPIDGQAYAAEAAFLIRFARHLGDASCPPGPPLAAQIAALEELSRRHDSNLHLGGNPVLTKNLSILYDDLYLHACLFPRLDGSRMRLAEQRARFAILALDRFPDSNGPNGASLRVPSRLFLLSRRVLRYLVAGSLRLALRQSLDFINPRNLATPAFPAVLLRWSASSTGMSRLLEFRRRLSALTGPDGFRDRAPDVWAMALACCGGEARLALEMLGGIIAQRKGPLRFIQREGRGRDHRRSCDGFAAAAQSFFLLGILHEKSRRLSGRSLLYPSGITSESPKFWHFYSAALVAFQLAAFPEKVVHRASFLIGAAYELFTIPVNIRLMASYGAGNSLGRNLTSLASDIRLHSAGGHFGWKLAQPNLPA